MKAEVLAPLALLAVPTPPPYSGPEVNGQRLLKGGLAPFFRVVHLRTNVSDENAAKGNVSIEKLVRTAALAGRLCEMLVTKRPRIVYLYLSQNLSGFLRDALVIMIARSFGTKVVAHVRGSNFSNFYGNANPPLRLLVKFVLRQVSRVILVAERFRTQFETLIPKDRISTLPNAVDLREFGPLQRSPAEDNRFAMLFMGHLSHAKGFGDLLACLPDVFDLIPEASLTVAGEWLSNDKNILFDEEGRRLRPDDGRILYAWRDLKSRYGSRLECLGVLNGRRKIEAFSACDVLVLPSYSEGFPMVVLEAMAAGLALVVTPVGALAEVLRGGENVRFVRPGDVKGLSRALLEMGRAPEARREMGKMNRVLVEKRFTEERVNRQLSEILLEVVRAARPAELAWHGMSHEQ